MTEVPGEIPSIIREILGDELRPSVERPTSWHLAERLPEDVLSEVGRIALSATALEDAAYSVCRSIKPRHGPEDDCPIGRHIGEALRDLAAEVPEGELRSRAENWLTEARDALAERNAVLHSTPAERYPLDPGEPELLIHFPRDKSRPRVETPLTVEALRPVSARLKAAREGWVGLAVEAYPSHPSHGGKPS